LLPVGRVIGVKQLAIKELTTRKLTTEKSGAKKNRVALDFPQRYFRQKPESAFQIVF